MAQITPTGSASPEPSKSPSKGVERGNFLGRTFKRIVGKGSDVLHHLFHKSKQPPSSVAKISGRIQPQQKENEKTISDLKAKSNWDQIKINVAKSVIERIVNEHREGGAFGNISPDAVVVDINTSKVVEIRTNAGETLYLPPERKDRESDPQSKDVFSLGLLLGEMVGEYPRWVSSSLTDMGVLGSNYPGNWKNAADQVGVNQLLHRMTHPDPKMRPRMEEVLESFNQLYRVD